MSLPIFLLTDFGLADPFVGIMKAVILGIAPDAPVVDLTHAIPAQDVSAGAMALEDAWPWLPERAVVCAVVDPGVGSGRRAIAAKIGKKFLVGPDNGLLAPIIQSAAEEVVVVQVEAGGPIRPQDSATFHGRDVFAPAAALLASGTKIKKLGPEVADWVRLGRPMPELREDGGLDLRVIAIDRFGNLTLNLRLTEVERLAPWIADGPVLAGVGRHVVKGLSRTYSDVPVGKPALYWNSAGRLEVAINGGSAARDWDITVGREARLEHARL